MKISKYKLMTQDLDQVVNYLADHLLFDYENHGAAMSVLAQEEFHLRSSSIQLNMIIAKRLEDYIQIDIMGSAWGSGILNQDFGSEKGYLRSAFIVLERYCEEFEVRLEVLEDIE